MPPRTRTRTGLLAVAVLLLPATSAADNPAALRAHGAELAAAERTATVELFSIESRLQRAQTELDSVRVRITNLERDRSVLRRQLRSARRTLAIAEQQLAVQVHDLYLQDQPDALAVFLGAASFEEAVEGIDALRRSAKASTEILEQARAARFNVVRLLRSLAGRRRALESLRVAAVARTQELAAARSRRLDYIEQLRREESLNEQQIAETIAGAQAAQAAAQYETVKAEATDSIDSVSANAVAPSEPPLQPQPSPQAPVAQSGRRLTVVATAYTLRGRTATGIPTGPGIVAVDPAVIPLGTRMTIPDYGEGVAADTGGAIKGLRIDLWVATAREAAQWQWRTVTITLH